MLGVSDKGNSKKIIVANFLITFIVQVAWLLYEMLPNPPSVLEIYGIVIKSLALTLAFYGLNRVVVKSDEPS